MPEQNTKLYIKTELKKIGTRLELGLTRMAINYMLRDKCGSRKYNIKSIERITGGPIRD